MTKFYVRRHFAVECLAHNTHHVQLHSAAPAHGKIRTHKNTHSSTRGNTHSSSLNNTYSSSSRTVV